MCLTMQTWRLTGAGLSSPWKIPRLSGGTRIWDSGRRNVQGEVELDLPQSQKAINRVPIFFMD